MGEYADYNGEQIKIGTCEEMYYLRADQADLVTAIPNSLDPVRERQAIRFRFPWPKEDHVKPGQFDNHEQALVLWGMEAPAELADDHYSVQFSASNGYLCSLPCPESGKVPEGLTIHRNGYGGAVELYQQRWVGDDLVPILRCKGCRMAWRLQTLEDAQPALDALEAMAAEQDARSASGNAEIAEEYREIARRIVAGYATAVNA